MFSGISDCLAEYLQNSDEYNHQYLSDSLEYCDVTFLMNLKEYTEFLLENQIIIDSSNRKKMREIKNIIDSCLVKQYA